MVFREQEFAIPRARRGRRAARDRPLAGAPGNAIGFPVEVRFSGPDDAWLSMAYGRETAWIAAQTHHRQEHGPYMRRSPTSPAPSAGGRTGASCTAWRPSGLRTVYPRFDDALAVRDVVDAQRLFANAYLDRVLGP